MRELEHAIEQAVVLASATTIELDDLPAACAARRRAAPRRRPAPGPRRPPARFKDAKQRVVERFERQFIADALARHQGNISKAAEEMGMYRQHLQEKLAELGIDADQFRRKSGE